MCKWRYWLAQRWFFGSRPMLTILNFQRSPRLSFYQMLMFIDVIKNLVYAFASDSAQWPYDCFDLARYFHKSHARIFHLILGSFSFVYMITLTHFRRLDRNKLLQWFDIHIRSDFDNPSSNEQQASSLIGSHFIKPSKLWLYFLKSNNFLLQHRPVQPASELNKHVNMLNEHYSFTKRRQRTQPLFDCTRPSQILTPDFLVIRLKLLLQIDRAHQAIQTSAQTVVISYSATTTGYFVAAAQKTRDWRIYCTLTAIGWIHSMLAFYLYNRTLVLQNALYISDALQLLFALRSLHKQLHLLAIANKFSPHRRSQLFRRSLCHVQHVHGHFRHSSRYFNRVFGISFFIAFFASCFLMFAIVYFQLTNVEKCILISCATMLITVYNVMPSLINSSIQAAVRFASSSSFLTNSPFTSITSLSLLSSFCEIFAFLKVSKHHLSFVIHF